MSPKLVIGANGFLGSHVTRQLVAAGHDVRIMVRAGANTVGVDDLDTERFVGDIGDDAVLRAAMTGCDDVYYCVVDARGWLTDPAPLYRTNVEGTRNVLDVAEAVHRGHPFRKFIFTSSYATVDRRRGYRAGEADEITDEGGLTDYVRSRVQAERMVLARARAGALPAVAMCVSTTYGTGDWGRTPHGAIIAGAAFGKLPFLLGGIELETVGVDDAARAMILAAEHGRVGERYLISEKMISNAEVVRIAAEAVGVPAPTRTIPPPVAYAMAALGTAKSRLRGSDERLTLNALRLMRAEAPVDHSRAVRELGWRPEPVEESIRAAARWWVDLRAANLAAQPRRMVDGARPPHEVRELVPELGHEGRVAQGLVVGGLEFVQRVDQRLGDEGAAVRAEVPARIGLVVVQHRVQSSCIGARRASASRTAWQNRRISPASLMPLADSTPELTSTAQGRRRAMPSVTFAGFNPPDKTTGAGTEAGTRDQSKGFPPPP